MKKVGLILILGTIGFLKANSQTKETSVIVFPPPVFATADLNEYKDQKILVCDTLSSYKILNDTTTSVILKNKFSGAKLDVLLVGKNFNTNTLKKYINKRIGFFGDLVFISEQPQLKVTEKNNIVEFL